MNSIAAVRLDFVILLSSSVILLSIALAGCSNASNYGGRGRELVQQYQCGTCHRIPGVNAANGAIAVTLESFGVRSYIAGHVPNTDENLARWLINPAAIVPGTLMSNMGVTPDDARDIAAYLRQLR
jgi:cytochrome c